MQLRDGRLVFSPTDLNAFVECEHLTRLELEVVRGERTKPERENPQADLLKRKGVEHELAYLETLRRDGRTIVEIELDEAEWDLERAARETEEAMLAGADVVYQAVLRAGGWRGLADFLERVDRPSELGSWSYEAVDTKLARHPKPHYILQLCFYSEQVARIQGVEPELMHVVLGTNERASFRPADFAAYFRRVRASFRAAVAAGLETEPYPVDHCSLCDFLPECERWWEETDHLTRVARIRRDEIERLAPVGITTLAALGQAAPDTSVPRMASSTFATIRDQAALQLEARLTGRHRVRLLEPEEKRGFELLPRPSPGDLFFDMEGDPFWEPGRGLEYLFGVLWSERGEERFRAFWAHDRDSERRAFEDFVDFVHERLDADPNLHVYHYAPYEPTALKRLMGEHATREEAVDELLRRDVLVDLYAVVRQSLRASLPGYSIKDLETFYMERKADLRSGDDATVLFEEWVQSRDDAVLRKIEDYNREDCRSTLLLRDWLLERRADAEAEWGRELAWRQPPERREVSEEAAAALDERERLRAELLAEAEEGDPRWLAAQLLDYHRREAKPVWWWFFRRLTLTSEELVDDSDSIGGLEHVRSFRLDPPKRSTVHVFRFPPEQQHRLDVGDSVVDPVTGKAAGWISALDSDAGELELVRGPKLDDVALPRALIPGGPYDTRAQRAALVRFATSLQDGERRYPGLESILCRELPLGGARVQRSTLAEMRELMLGLDGTHLFVQGPPGSGKTWTGARLVTHLLDRGKRVGVASMSHKAIHNFLREVEVAAAEEGVEFRGLKKCSSDNPESVYEGRWIESESDIGAFVDPAVGLVAGTAWLFAREELDSTLDYLFVDEAGQVSLADALAMGTAARTVVLLGDPLQLAQVTQGLHPPGSAASALEHLLGGDRTVPEERGLFLERSWRMHPDVARFVSDAFYEGRLASAPECARQTTEFGTGIRYVPVEHVANRQFSHEEADRIRAEILGMVGGSYTDANGVTRPLAEDGFMVVAPYNWQVRVLRETLPAGVRIGTVDKFQGQEAPVVFFSMASSSGDDIPRGLEFLFSRNRLNVAISRARCLAFLVASPRLLETKCRTIEQMRLVNALCRFVELAATEREPLSESV